MVAPPVQCISNTSSKTRSLGITKGATRSSGPMARRKVISITTNGGGKEMVRRINCLKLLCRPHRPSLKVKDVKPLDPIKYYQSQRLDSWLPLEKQGGGDPRSLPHQEDMDTGYEDNNMVQTFEGLKQRFLDDVMKLSKEQTDAEDSEMLGIGRSKRLLEHTVYCIQMSSSEVGISAARCTLHLEEDSGHNTMLMRE